MHACAESVSMQIVHAAIATAVVKHRTAQSTLCHTMSRHMLQMHSQLLGWYDKNHRALPWRRNAHTQTAAADDPEHKALLDLPQQQMIYRVWISEIMCQQTQVGMSLRLISSCPQQCTGCSTLCGL